MISNHTVQNKPDLYSKLLTLYHTIGTEIAARFKEFNRFRQSGTDEELFGELVFCLLTPQSGARRCWTALKHLHDRDLVFNGRRQEIADEIRTVRFRHTKAENIVRARNLFLDREKPGLRRFLLETGSPQDMRQRLVMAVRGMGHKEASHFLRNIGFGNDLAILDRHILRSLVALDVIDAIPSSLSRLRYLSIEEKMRSFSQAIGIPLHHLDFLLWYRETGDIFK